jgi:type III restriction enzyme
MPVWYTGRPCEKTKRSHISHAVFDSRWEATEAFELDRNKNVAAWVKNDHLGFEIVYTFKGVVHKYRPDFLIRLVNDVMLVLEVKGRDGAEDRTKREFLAEWVQTINEYGGFGLWKTDVSFVPSDVKDILKKHVV